MSKMAHNGHKYTKRHSVPLHTGGVMMSEELFGPMKKLPRVQLKPRLHTQESQPKSYRSCERKESLKPPPPIRNNSCGSQMGALFRKFDEMLNKAFRRLGETVAKNTGYFIIIPLLLSFLASTGLQNLKFENDPEYLFAPTHGPAKDERTRIEHFFPTNYSKDFDPSRITRSGHFVRLIITPKDGGEVMRPEIWDDVFSLDDMVQQQISYYDEEWYKFQDICALWNNKCVENKILTIKELLPAVFNGSMQLSFPITLNPNSFEVYFIALFFGGVRFNDNDGIVTDTKALSLFYWLKGGTEKESERSLAWERLLLHNVQTTNFTNIKTAIFTSETLPGELDKNTYSVIPYFAVALVLMGIFCSLTLLMSDWVRSKTYLGLLGISSAMFACGTAFGILTYCGVPFIGINLASPFLMLGIGMDDMFVLLAAWRRTKLQDPVEKRLGDTYAEAAVSITITSLTDMISFFIGVATPFPSVQIFCLCTGTAVLMTYLWKITFFGACMAIAGRKETEQKHSLFCHPVLAKSQAVMRKGCCYTFWCAGGINEADPYHPMDNKPHSVMLFFKTHVAKVLNITLVKALVIIVFFAYMVGAIYGCMNLKEGLERRRLSRYDSYSVEFYDLEDKYFREYPYRIQVMISGDLNYSDTNTKEQILDLHRTLENQTFMAGSLYTESFLRGWYEFIANNAEYMDIDITTEKGFIKNLREIYLVGDDNTDRIDVIFNDNYTQILASRFIVQTYRILDSNADKAMMTNLRKIAEESPLNVTLYHPHFVFFDQFMLVKSVSMKATGFAAFIMILVSLLFIPNPWCSLWIAFSIISIELGVVGYMTMWGVNLDSISMINLIMCIGFSVDFSAHISYAYLTAQVKTPAERVSECLFTLGLPILQGAVSTILGVIVLVTAPSYIFVTFFKTVFLVIFFGAMHGIFLLPVLLSLLGPGSEEDTTSPADETSYDVDAITLEEFTPPMTVKPRKDPPVQPPVNSPREDDKDMGIGTSESSSSDNSLSKATGATKNEGWPLKHKDCPAINYFSNLAYTPDEPDSPELNPKEIRRNVENYRSYAPRSRTRDHAYRTNKGPRS